MLDYVKYLVAKQSPREEISMNEKKEELFFDEFEAMVPVLSRLFHEGGIEDMAGLELTIPQFIVLSAISRKGSPKMTDLAHEMNTTLGNVTTIVERIVKEGYLERGSDPDDRRIVRVALTNKGKTFMKKAAEHKRKNFGKIFGKMEEADRKTVLNIMKKLADAINMNTEGRE